MPARKPTKVKELQGTARKHRINRAEPQPGPASISPPAWLSEDGVDIWDERAPTLVDLGIITETDVDAFGLYCQALADYQRLAKMIREHGEVVETISKRGKIVQKNPLCTIQNEKWETIKTLSQRYGLTPADRSKIEAKPANAKDELDNILKLAE